MAHVAEATPNKPRTTLAQRLVWVLFAAQQLCDAGSVAVAPIWKMEPTAKTVLLLIATNLATCLIIAYFAWRTVSGVIWARVISAVYSAIALIVAATMFRWPPPNATAFSWVDAGITLIFFAVLLIFWKDFPAQPPIAMKPPRNAYEKPRKPKTALWLSLACFASLVLATLHRNSAMCDVARFHCNELYSKELAGSPSGEIELKKLLEKYGPVESFAIEGVFEDWNQGHVVLLVTRKGKALREEVVSYRDKIQSVTRK